MIVSIDTETTGLDPRHHDAWEVALVLEDGQEACWQFSVDISAADGGALAIGGFYDRYLLHDRPNYAYQDWDGDFCSPLQSAKRIAELTEGATLLGCNPHFDAAFVTKLLRAQGLEPAWSHRFLDLGSYAAGRQRVSRPLSSQALAVTVANPSAHTALGDARWNMKVYEDLRG